MILCLQASLAAWKCTTLCQAMLADDAVPCVKPSWLHDNVSLVSSHLGYTWSCLVLHQAILAIHDHVLSCVEPSWLYMIMSWLVSKHLCYLIYKYKYIYIYIYLYAFIKSMLSQDKRLMLMNILKYLVFWLKPCSVYAETDSPPKHKFLNWIWPVLHVAKAIHDIHNMYILNSFKLKPTAHTVYTSLIIAITPALWVDSWVVSSGHLWRKRQHDSGWVDWILSWV